jgi:hypothetical protein
VADARRAARAEAEGLIEAAAKGAEQEKKERLGRAMAEIRDRLRLEERVSRSAVEGVVRCVCGGPPSARG